jgi:hypothetical protein
MRASRIFAFARESRCPIADGRTRNTDAMRAAFSPSTVWSMSGVRAAASIAGWVQRNSSLSRSSGNTRALPATASASSAIAIRAGRASACTRARRAASMSRRRATVRSHASGFSGTPVSGQVSRAARKASASASSAAATSRERTARNATSRP